MVFSFQLIFFYFTLNFNFIIIFFLIPKKATSSVLLEISTAGSGLGKKIHRPH